MVNTVVENKGNITSSPLSFEQERLFFQSRFYSNPSIFNLTFMIRITGLLKLNLLEKSINKIIERHKIFRASFPASEDIPIQIIKPFEYFKLPIYDISHLPIKDHDRVLQKYFLKELQYDFDLNKNLFRFQLVQISVQEHVLILNFHGLIFDENSKQIFINEMFSVYKSLSFEESFQQPSLKMQYIDYIQNQRQTCFDESVNQEISYWNKKLEGELPDLNLPINHPRQTFSEFEGENYHFTISDDVMNKIELLSQKEKVDAFQVLMTIFIILLHRYTGENDIAVGTNTSGRILPEHIPLIGLLENTLVIRTDLQEEMTFQEALHLTRKVTMEAYAHQYIPFAKLVPSLNPKRNVYNSTPYFNVMLNMHHALLDRVEVPGLKLEEINSEQTTAFVDLKLTVSITDDQLRCFFTYDKHLFERETIIRMSGHLKTMLDGVLENPKLAISRIPILTPQERHLLLVEWNKPTIKNPINSTIHQLFEEQVCQTPNEIAIFCGDTQITYKELDRLSEKVKMNLIKMGLKKEQLVAICLERSPEMIAGFLGVLKAGGAYVPVDLGYPKERIQYILEDSGAQYIITKASIYKDLPCTTAKAIYIDELPEKIEDQFENFQRVKPENLAYVMYTSGSTGKPKGVTIEHRGIVRLVKNITYADVGPQEIILNRAPVAFDASVFEIYGSLLNGGKLVLINDIKPTFKDIANAIKINKVTTLRSTPGILNVLLEEYSEDLGSLRQVISSGEALPVMVAQTLLSKLPECKLINAYGPTENSVSSTSYHVKEISKDASSIPIGRPISNDCVYILDKNREPVPIGVVGDLYLSGVGTARGYFNKPDITREKFSINPFTSEHNIRMYKSGDLAKYCPDGNIEFIGRVDNQVKIRGYRIELGEVESIIGLFPGVHQAVASTTNSKDGSSDLVVYIIMKKGCIFNRQKIRAFAQEKMPHHMIPTFFVELQEFPVTPVGKIDRKKLPEPVIEVSSKSITLPRNETEEKLVKIWEELLGVRPIGVKDHYFELGGNSLLAMKMFTEIKKMFNNTLPVSIIFQEDTIERLAAILSSKSKNVEESIVPIQPTGTKPPLFCIHGGGGEVLIYKDLSVSLGTDQPLYGLRYKNNENSSHISIEGLAERYVDEIKKIQPFGPYHILGFCFGGAIAYEMAQRIISAGEEVASLSILNFGNPNSRPYIVKKQSEVTIKDVIKKNLIILMEIPAREKAAFFFEKVKNASQLIIYRPKTSITKNELVSTRSILREAMSLYKPQPYPGDIQIIRAGKSNTDIDKLGWETSGYGRITVHCIPAEHETLLKEPFVGLVAKFINEHLVVDIK